MASTTRASRYTAEEADRILQAANPPPDVGVPRLALRVGEAATALSISRSKMYGLIAAGKVRAVLVGEVMRVRVSDLEAFLAENYAEKNIEIGS